MMSVPQQRVQKISEHVTGIASDKEELRRLVAKAVKDFPDGFNLCTLKRKIGQPVKLNVLQSAAFHNICKVVKLEGACGHIVVAP